MVSPSRISRCQRLVLGPALLNLAFPLPGGAYEKACKAALSWSAYCGDLKKSSCLPAAELDL